MQHAKTIEAVREGEIKVKKKEKQIIGVLAIIIIFIIIVAVVFKVKNSKEENLANIQEENVVAEEFVDVLEDGTRVNKSEKLHETKIFDGLEISNFRLTEKENVTLLLGTITNRSSEVKGDYPINIKVVDKNGNEIVTVSAYIGKLEVGESCELNTSATFDYANAYDIEISKK